VDRLTELNLLFLEDNIEFALHTSELLGIYFKKVFHCKNIKEASETFNEHRIDAMICDVMISGKNGLDFIQEVRKTDEKCIVCVLSAYKDEEYLLKAIPLNLTAYELKPIRYDDLMLLLKKISAKLTPRVTAKIGGTLSYNFKTKELLVRKRPIQLTKKEFLFTELLIKSYPVPIEPQRVQRDIWESRVMSDAAIKNMIFRLRKKVGIDFILTMQGVGYKLASPISF
jgi:DNA-binding response OmpR family regulator